MKKSLSEALHVLEKALGKVETVTEKKAREKEEKRKEGYAILQDIFKEKEEKEEKLKARLDKNKLILEKEERELDKLTEELVTLEISGETIKIPQKEKAILSKRQFLDEIKNKQKAYRRLESQSYPFKREEKALVLDAISLVADITMTTDELRTAVELIKKMNDTVTLLEKAVEKHRVDHVSRQDHYKEKEINWLLSKYFSVNPLLQSAFPGGRKVSEPERNNLIQSWLKSEEEDLKDYLIKWYKKTERVGY